MEDHHSIEAVMARMEGVLDTFDRITRHAHTVYRAYAPAHLIEHSSRAQATCIYDHMVAEARRAFDGRAGIRPLEIRGLFVWAFDDHTVVRFKKMDEDGRSRNYPTKQAKAFDRQTRLQGLPPDATRITVGYLLDAAQQNFVRTQIARPISRQMIEWCAAIVPADARVADARKWEDITRQAKLIA